MPKNPDLKAKKKKENAEKIATRREEKAAVRSQTSPKKTHKTRQARGKAYKGHISNQRNENLLAMVGKFMPGWEEAKSELERRGYAFDFSNNRWQIESKPGSNKASA